MKKLKADVQEIIPILFRYKEVKIIEGTVCKDYIYLNI